MSHESNTKLIEELVDLANATDDRRIIDFAAMLVNSANVDMERVQEMIAELRLMNEVEDGSFIGNY